MIGETNGDLASTLVTGDPLTEDADEITVTIPLDFVGTLFYFCTVHGAMSQQFEISQPLHGKLSFWTDEKLVMSYHKGGGNVSTTWSMYRDRDKGSNLIVSQRCTKRWMALLC
jgi:hypothetical protein